MCVTAILYNYILLLCVLYSKAKAKSPGKKGKSVARKRTTTAAGPLSIYDAFRSNYRNDARSKSKQGGGDKGSTPFRATRQAYR